MDHGVCLRVNGNETKEKPMNWIIYLEQIMRFFEERCVEVFVLKDGRCKGNLRLFFEDNVDGFVSNTMRDKYPNVRYTLATESEVLRKKFRLIRSKATLHWLGG